MNQLNLFSSLTYTKSPKSEALEQEQIEKRKNVEATLDIIYDKVEYTPKINGFIVRSGEACGIVGVDGVEVTPVRFSNIQVILPDVIKTYGDYVDIPTNDRGSKEIKEDLGFAMSLGIKKTAVYNNKGEEILPFDNYTKNISLQNVGLFFGQAWYADYNNIKFIRYTGGTQELSNRIVMVETSLCLPSIVRVYKYIGEPWLGDNIDHPYSDEQIVDFVERIKERNAFKGERFLPNLSAEYECYQYDIVDNKLLTATCYRDYFDSVIDLELDESTGKLLNIKDKRLETSIRWLKEVNSPETDYKLGIIHGKRVLLNSNYIPVDIITRAKWWKQLYR